MEEEGRSKRGKKLVLAPGLPDPERKSRKPLTQEQLEERRKKVSGGHDFVEDKKFIVIIVQIVIKFILFFITRS